MKNRLILVMLVVIANYISFLNISECGFFSNSKNVTVTQQIQGANNDDLLKTELIQGANSQDLLKTEQIQIEQFNPMYYVKNTINDLENNKFDNFNNNIIRALIETLDSGKSIITRYYFNESNRLLFKAEKKFTKSNENKKAQYCEYAYLGFRKYVKDKIKDKSIQDADQCANYCSNVRATYDYKEIAKQANITDLSYTYRSNLNQGLGLSGAITDSGEKDGLRYFEIHIKKAKKDLKYFKNYTMEFKNLPKDLDIVSFTTDINEHGIRLAIENNDLFAIKEGNNINKYLAIKNNNGELLNDEEMRVFLEKISKK